MRRRKSYRKRKKISPIKVIIPVVVILGILVGSVMFYVKWLSKSCLGQLSSVDKFNVEDSVLSLNDVELDLNSSLLFVREYTGSKFRNSNILELIEALNTGNINFCKKMNLVVYEVNPSSYKIYSSSKAKLRFSEMSDGYLLEVDNRSGSNKNLFYNSSGKVSKNSSEDSKSLLIKTGLNQIHIPSDVEISSLARNLVNEIK